MRIVVRLFNCVVLGIVARVWLSSFAADFYVSPSGSASGNGSQANPWDLQTALNQPATVHAGDTIWLRGGVYIPPGGNGFVSYLNGANGSPIIVRQYTGEHATLREIPNYTGSVVQDILQVYGSYTWFWGFEIASTNTLRVIGGTDNNPHELPLPSSIDALNGPGFRFINLIVHDVRGGPGAWENATDCEIYGCLVYNTGWFATNETRVNHGPGMYIQNLNGLKHLSDNVIFGGLYNGIQGYTENSDLQNFLLENNILFNNSVAAVWPNSTADQQILFGGGPRIVNLKLLNNCTYLPLFILSNQDATDYGAQANSDVVFAGNYFVGGGGTNSGGSRFQVTSTLYDSVVFTNNTLITTNGGFLALNSNRNYVVNNNTYYGTNSLNFGISPTVYLWTFSDWKFNTGFDSQSTLAFGLPATNRVFVFPNAYESNRANIAIYNWQDSNIVTVDVSSILTVGDTYQLLNAQDFYGPPVLTGTYTGAALSVPMTNLTYAIPNGWPWPVTVYNSTKQFNAFVLFGATNSNISIARTMTVHFTNSVTVTTCPLEASTNLHDWAAIGTATNTAPGVFQFTDPNAGAYPRRFYRAHYSP